MARRASLLLNPVKALMDETVQIRVKGLFPRQPVTLSAYLTENNTEFVAHGQYIATDEGEVDLTKQESTGGTYHGLRPMGLFWSLGAVAGQRAFVRLGKKDVTTPYNFTLAVLNGHVFSDSLEEHHTGQYVIHQRKLERTYMADHVVRIPINEGQIRGTLFLPNKGEGRFPGVIDLMGNPGGLPEHRAALLASRGFATLALAYFKYKDLPSFPAPLHLEYFEEAVDWLQSHANVKPGGIGGVGLSNGSNILLALASYTQKPKCVVSISTHDKNLYTDYLYQGQTLPAAVPNQDEAIEPDGSIRLQQVYEDVPDSEEYMIPIERAHSTQFLFIHGVDDQMADVINQNKLMVRLRQHLMSNFEAHLYGGTGHIIEPPYTPVCKKAYHPGFKKVNTYGGESRQHSRAQEEAWNHTLRFLRENLP